MIHRTKSPLGIDDWYPVLRGGTAPLATISTNDPNAYDKVLDACEELEDGQRLVLLGSTVRTGGRSDLSQLEDALRGNGTRERFIVFPGTGGAFTLLPTVDRTALRAGISLLPSGRLRGRALWTVLRTLTPFGVAQRLGRPELTIWTKGPDQRAELDLPILPVAGSIAIAAGVPDRNQKIIVRALDRRGAARAIVKIGRSIRTDDAVEREADVLTQVDEILDGRAPRLLAHGQRAGRTWLAQEVIEGRHSGTLITPAHAEFLLALGQPTLARVPLEDLHTYKDSQRNLSNLRAEFDPDWHADYSRLRDALSLVSDSDDVPVTAAHGDFTPWNTRLCRGQLRAFDWEYFSLVAPAAYDLAHFHMQASVLVRQFPGERIFDSLPGFFRGPAAEVVRGLALQPSDIIRALGLYILHEGTAAEVLERQQPAPFDQASWLRRARLEICHRIAGLLLERRVPSWALFATKSRSRAA